MSEFTTVIFDLDGTLVDSSADIAEAMNRAITPAGFPPVTPAQVASYLGGGPQVLLAKCLGPSFDALDREQVDQLLAAYSAHYRAAPAARTLVLDTAASVLPRLSAAGIKVGICTNKRTGIAQDVLQAINLSGSVKVLIGSDMARVPKPDPSHLLQTVEALGSTVADVLYVGDTSIDSAASHAAGIAYAHVAWGEHDVPRQHQLASFDDLLPLLSMTEPATGE